MKNKNSFLQTLITSPGRLFLFVIITACVLAFVFTGVITGVPLYFFGALILSIFDVIILKENFEVYKQQKSQESK